MKSFNVTVSNESGVIAKFPAIGMSSCSVEEAARSEFDIPVGVTVIPC